ncbi:hypothetical protein KR009_001280 [Drosophila setifemur]|nr:hypothetical protein KR009_001280 [Drosophila setifemur]
MRPYICFMELPINRPGCGNLLLGLTSVVGLIGGAYLLQCGAQRVLGKLANKKWKKEDTSDDHNCNVCCADLDLSSAKNYVSCCTCGKTVCRGLKCADWRPKDAKWECQLCQSSKESLAQTSSWVAEQMSFNQHKFVYPMRARSEVYIPIAGDGNDSSMQFESVSQIGQQTSPDERSKIREYVEEIVAEMLSSNLDHIKVGQLSKSENYLQLFDKYHAKLSNLLINVENGLCARALKGDLPAIVNSHNSNNNNNNNNNGDSELADISQTRLRSLIETIIAETLRSSSLNASGAVSEISLDTRSHVSELANGNGLKRRHRTEHYFEPKIYQDLLATAVLNKIADKEGNSGLITESTPDLSGRHIDENFNAEVLSTTSGSSIEPRSDCSLTDHEIGLDNGKSQSLQTDLERESVLSDYIAGHMVPLPDFSASVTESEDDIGSISSSMIGDGNWEDNWLFKKKRSSANPSSIGMLVPAPKDNVRAQIGDKTADEVSDLSEMGSDIEDSSLDLLHCNDLNDRLLSKHLIGGQNTKLVLDELVDRTSLTSHTVPEEHEPAFTETTNSLLVAGRPVPTTSPPPPPPMIFQDDSLSEGPAQAPITAQDETDELASLEGCIGFSTVEYIDEEQMHETIPSVIEILAAMALGPMLAIPASEQPGAMTPSEMHTLKELSDLALAEINARTMDIAHHSLDIIEEENSEPAEPVSEPQFCITESPEQDNDFTAAPMQGVEESQIVSLEPSANVEVVHESTSTTMETPAPVEAHPEEEEVIVEPPDPVEVVLEPEYVVLEPSVSDEPVQETDFVSMDSPVAGETVSQPDSVLVEPPALADAIPEPESVAVEIPATEEVLSEPESIAVEQTEVVKSSSEPESDVVEPPIPVNVAPEPVSVAEEPSGPVEADSEPESVIVEPSAEIVSNPESVAVEPPASFHITPDLESVSTELTTMESAAPADAVLEPESIVVEPESIVVKPPAPVEVDPEAEVAALQSAIPVIEPESLVVVSAEPEEVVPEQESIPVEQVALEADPVVVEPPAPVQIVSDAESAVVEPTAPIEVVADLGIVTMEPPPQAEGESSAIVTPAPVEAHPEPESVTVEPPDPDEVMSEQESMLLEQPALMEVVRQADNIDVEPPEAVEAIPKPEIATVGNSAAVEVVSKTEYIAFEPEEAVQNIPEQELVIVEQSAPIEFTPEPESVLVEQPGTVDVKSEADVDVREKTESEPEFIAVEQESVVNAPAHVEVVPEAESADIESQRNVEAVPEPVSLIMEPIVSAEVLQEPESIEVEPDEAGIETIPETITPKPESVSVQQPVTEENIEPEPSAPVEAVPKPEFIAVDTESVVVNSSAPIVPEIKSAAVQPVPHIPPDPEPELVAVEPPALAEPDSIKVEPEETVDVVAEPDSIAIDLAAPSELLSEPVSDIVEPTDIEEVVADPESIVAEAVAPTAVVPRPEVVTVEAHVEESIAAVPPTPAEVVAESDSITVETPAPTQIVNKPEAGSNAVEFLAPVPQAESAAVEVVSVPESVTVKPSVVPEQGTAGVEPHAHITVIDEPESNKVGPLAPVEIVPENESVLLEPPAPEPESNAVEPAAPGEVVPEPAASVEISPKPEFVSAEPPAPVEIISEPNSVGVEPAESVQTVTDPQFVVGKPPDPVEVVPEIVAVEPESPVEAVSDQKSIIAKPPAPIENITDIKVEPEFLAEELPESVEVVAEPESIGLEPPGLAGSNPVELSAPVKIVCEADFATVEVFSAPESVAVELPAAVEVVKENESVILEPPAPEPESNAVEPPALVEVFSEPNSIEVKPAESVEIVPDPQFLVGKPPDPVEVLPEIVAVDPKEPMDGVEEIKFVIIDPPVPGPESNAVEPLGPEQVVSDPKCIGLQPADIVGVVPDPESSVEKSPDPVKVVSVPEIVALEPEAPAEVVAEPELTSIEAAAPVKIEAESLGVKIVSESDSVAVEPAAPVEVVLHPESNKAEPPAPLEVLTESNKVEPESLAVGLSEPVEVLPKSEIVSVEPEVAVEESISVVLATPAEVIVEPDPISAELQARMPVFTQPEEPAQASNVIPEPIYIAVEPSAPVTIIPETESATVEVVSVPESVAVKSQVFSEPENAVVEPPAHVEVINEPESIKVEVLEPPAPVEIVSEPESVAVEPLTPVEVVTAPDIVALELEVPVDVVAESESTALEPTAPVKIVPESVAVEPAEPEEVVPDPELVIAKTPAPIEVITDPESITVEPESNAVELTEPVDDLPEPESIGLEVVAEPESIAAEPAAAEISPEPESVQVESAPIVDVVPKTEIVVMEVPAPVNAVPHTDPVGEPEFEIVELVGEPDVTPQTPVFDPESAVLPLADSDAEPNLAGLEPPASSVIIRATESEGAEPESAIVRIDQGSDVIQLTDSAVEASVCTPVEIGPDSPPETLKLLSTNDPSSFSIDTDVPEKSAIESDISILQSTAKSIQENTSLESAKIDCNALGKASQKCLRRQPNIPDTTPSDKDSPLRSNPVNLLGTICKFYIKDKRLLATIERRRRRSLIMHKYLSSFDSMDDSLDENIFDPSLVEELQEDSLAPPAEMIPPIGRAKTPPSEDNPIDFIEDILALGSVRSESTEQLHSPLRRTETIILDGHPNRFVEDRFALQTTTTEDFKDNASIGIDTFQYIAITENSPESHIDLDFDNSVPEDNRLVTIQKSDSASQTSSEGPDEDDVEAESFIVVSLSEITYNFINEILFSDQLSLESNHSDESEPSTACETFNEDADSDQEVVSERVLVLDEHLTQNTNSNSNRTSHANLHLTLTKTNTPNSGSRRTNGKLTNGSLRWSNKQSSVVEVANGGPASAQQDDVADDDVVLLRRFVPGSIAEREVKKWYNAVEMPNNPYAPEALKQRISGTQERYMDVPNISPSAEQKALASALTENPEPPSPQTDYKRYSRDYYINNAPIGTAGSEKASASLSSADPQHIRSAEDIVEDIVINEVNQEPEPHPPHGRISSSAQTKVADLSHWTLSTPVRRTSSLKFINSRPSHSPFHSLAYDRPAPIARPSTSASHYRESSLTIGDDDDFDVRSLRSWRSSYSSLPKRHTQSSLSLHSSGSGVSFGSSASKRGQASGGPSAAVLIQFEKQLLHKDLKRNSFRAVSATSKDFVMNPLFESEPIQAVKLALRPEAEDQGDSGVDSCLNGFSGADTKFSNNSLLF